MTVIKPAVKIMDAPALMVNGVKFHFWKTDIGDELRSEDQKILIQPQQGNRRVTNTYRARYLHPRLDAFWCDVYSKRTGAVRSFNYPISAARQVTLILKHISEGRM